MIGHQRSVPKLKLNRFAPSHASRLRFAAFTSNVASTKRARLATLDTNVLRGVSVELPARGRWTNVSAEPTRPPARNVKLRRAGQSQQQSESPEEQFSVRTCARSTRISRASTLNGQRFLRGQLQPRLPATIPSSHLGLPHTRTFAEIKGGALDRYWLNPDGPVPTGHRCWHPRLDEGGKTAGFSIRKSAWRKRRPRDPTTAASIPVALALPRRWSNSGANNHSEATVNPSPARTAARTPSPVVTWTRPRTATETSVSACRNVQPPALARLVQNNRLQRE